MIVLGIDPGYALMGWGVVEANGSHMKLLATVASKRRPVPPCSTGCGRSNWASAT